MSRKTQKAPAIESADAVAEADERAHAFIKKWKGVPASELSTAQSFVSDLCRLLDVEPPHATTDHSYMFERPITFHHGDGSTSGGRVDCYKRGHFVWESKKLQNVPKAEDSAKKAIDAALLKARQQAEDYARALPADEGRPPIVVVADIGNVIELYAEFTRSGATYTPFPDPRNHQILLDQLVDPLIRHRLRAIWVDPMSLDPTRISAKVTREVAAELAGLAKSLEADGYSPHRVGAFLTRCLFSMFAEDVGLLPVAGAEEIGSFMLLLQTHRKDPETLAEMLKSFWSTMNLGGFNPAIAKRVLRFNGKIFKGAEEEGYALVLTTAQIDGLIRAAKAKWQEVEPAIFGTLLERALDPAERHSLGAHYTPRAYVERLVLPTVVEPLRADWANAQAAAIVLAREADALSGPKDVKKRDAKMAEARAEIRRFHHQLCTTRVLDPACGSGNFLYVTLEHLKRLEGEVINQLTALGETQDRLGFEGETVTLQQLLGIEINERAASLAELVLWIGWLQWHVRTLGLAGVAEPVVHDYGNIQNRDAVLTYDRTEPALNAQGRAITRWDGFTFKVHPVTGESVPDEAAQVPQLQYVSPKPAAWPAADYIVGNPPFIGNKRMRDALGDGYALTLRGMWPDVPESADFVMYWWNKAAQEVISGRTRQFGLITTNSLTMIFNRRVIERRLNGELHLRFAIADHPWVDAAGGAAVRIAMTVAAAGAGEGVVQTVKSEREAGEGEAEMSFATTIGLIHADLKIGANVGAAKALRALDGLSNRGVIPHGAAFILTTDQAAALGLGTVAGIEKRIRPYRNGRDLTERPRGALVIDTIGLSELQLRDGYPTIYQWLFDRAKPERDTARSGSIRRDWWLHARSRAAFRPALDSIARYVATGQVAKHRVFQFLPSSVLPDDKLIAIATDDALWLGVLSSQVHVAWSIATGGRLGVGNDAVYSKSTCFETFPFPSDDTGLTPERIARIRALGGRLDAHRKERQAAIESLGLTGMYNVLAKLRRGEVLSAKEKELHEDGLVSVLRSLHDELDAEVLEAYGWSDMGPVPWADEAAQVDWSEALLGRLVALNSRRASEEAAGLVRWLRPDFQDPSQASASGSAQADLEGVEGSEEATEADGATELAPASAAAVVVQQWPATLPDQVRAVAQMLAASPIALSLPSIEAGFKGRGPWKKGLPRILETLEALGRAQQAEGGWRG